MGDRWADAPWVKSQVSDLTLCMSKSMGISCLEGKSEKPEFPRGDLRFFTPGPWSYLPIPKFSCPRIFSSRFLNLIDPSMRFAGAYFPSTGRTLKTYDRMWPRDRLGWAHWCATPCGSVRVTVGNLPSERADQFHLDIGSRKG